MDVEMEELPLAAGVAFPPRGAEGAADAEMEGAPLTAGVAMVEDA